MNLNALGAGEQPYRPNATSVSMKQADAISESMSESEESTISFGSLPEEIEAADALRAYGIEFVVVEKDFGKRGFFKIIDELGLNASNCTAILARFRFDGKVRALPILLLADRYFGVEKLLATLLGSNADLVNATILPLNENSADSTNGHDGRDDTSGPQRAGGIILDSASNEAIVEGRTIALSRTEFKLLHYLASHPRQALNRQKLLSEALDRNNACGSRNIDVHIRRLREKIERRPSHPKYIETIRGAGYRFLPPERRRI
jgi:DNA-binding response OmpR family regulator